MWVIFAQRGKSREMKTLEWDQGTRFLWQYVTCNGKWINISARSFCSMLCFCRDAGVCRLYKLTEPADIDRDHNNKNKYCNYGECKIIDIRQNSLKVSLFFLCISRGLLLSYPYPYFLYVLLFLRFTFLFHLVFLHHLFFLSLLPFSSRVCLFAFVCFFLCLSDDLLKPFLIIFLYVCFLGV